MTHDRQRPCFICGHFEEGHDEYHVHYGDVHQFVPFPEATRVNTKSALPVTTWYVNDKPTSLGEQQFQVVRTNGTNVVTGLKECVIAEIIVQEHNRAEELAAAVEALTRERDAARHWHGVETAQRKESDALLESLQDAVRAFMPEFPSLGAEILAHMARHIGDLADALKASEERSLKKHNVKGGDVVRLKGNSEGERMTVFEVVRAHDGVSGDGRGLYCVWFDGDTPKGIWVSESSVEVVS